MSLIQNSMMNASRSQYLYKIKTRVGMFLAMAAVQVMALLFSLGGVGSIGRGSENLTLTIRYFSGEMVIWFTFLWMVVTAVLVATREYRDLDFTFVSSRLTGNLSNLGFLVTAAVLGGLTAMSGGVLLRLIVYFTESGATLIARDFFVSPRIFLIGTAVTTLYLLILGAAGYLGGVLVQLSKAFIVVLPGVFLGTLILARGTRMEILIKALDFFREESSLPLLAVKVILTAGALYGGAILLSNRLEVR